MSAARTGERAWAARSSSGWSRGRASSARDALHISATPWGNTVRFYLELEDIYLQFDLAR